jgi:hypothetical protein
MILIKNISFGMVLLTGVSFPLILLFTRLEFPEKLVSVIYFQSIIVFFTFIMQLGLRAGGRIHLHLGKVKTIDYVTSYIVRNAWKLGGLLTLLVILLDIPFYPSFIILQAVFSYLQALYLAKKHSLKVIYNSLLIFLSICVAGGCIIFIEADSTITAIIEILSLLSLICMSFKRNQKYEISKEKKLFLLLINRYKGLQYSSYIIYLTSFILAQIIVVIGENNQDVISTYADIILFCGLQLLVLGRVIVFIEGDIIKNKSYRKYIHYYLVWCVLSSYLFSLTYSYFINPNYSYFIFLISAATLSKLAFSFCSQYANSGARKYIYKLGVFSGSIHLALFVMINIDKSILDVTQLSIILFCFSGLSLSVILLGLEKHKKQNIFI